MSAGPPPSNLARPPRDHRAVSGTRRGRRTLGCFRQAALIPRWFPDGAVARTDRVAAPGHLARIAAVALVLLRLAYDRTI
ncbi:hypothetical protein ADK58_04685 [Streptomyces sp. XY152]|nr:hypothetical protein ADK58_04685 [Streptomyces sp. XY152]